MKSILTVCTGNICRSPMAQALLAHALPGMRVLSAGTHAVIGAEADPLAQAVLAPKGIRLDSHRAQQITAPLCQQADLILVMEDVHRQWVQHTFPFTRGRTFRVGEHGGWDVPDPYRKPLSEFEQALGHIEHGLQAWVGKLQKLI